MPNAAHGTANLDLFRNWERYRSREFRRLGGSTGAGWTWGGHPLFAGRNNRRDAALHGGGDDYQFGDTPQVRRLKVSVEKARPCLTTIGSKSHSVSHAHHVKR